MGYKNNLQCSQEDYYALACAVERYMNLVKRRDPDGVPDPEVMGAIMGIEEEQCI